MSASKQFASLPNSCSAALLNHYERVKTESLHDGELFRMTVDAKCSEDWRRALSQNENLDCDEDWMGPTDSVGPIRNPSIYGCLDVRDPDKFQVSVHFRDPAHVEFLWMKA